MRSTSNQACFSNPTGRHLAVGRLHMPADKHLRPFFCTFNTFLRIILQPLPSRIVF